MERFARLKIEWAVFDLDRDVRAELAVELGELDISALGAVGIDIFVVDERAPDDIAAMRRESIGQRLSPFGMVAVIIFRAGLTFAISFHKEAAEIGNEPVDFISLRLP